MSPPGPQSSWLELSPLLGKESGGKLGYVSMDTTFLVLFATTLKQEENSFNVKGEKDSETACILLPSFLTWSLSSRAKFKHE